MMTKMNIIKWRTRLFYEKSSQIWLLMK